MPNSWLVISLLLVVSSSIQMSGTPSNYIPEYFINSSKLINDSHRQMLYNWVNYGNPRTHLLWRGTQSKFNWTDLHNKVDNWGSLLLIIRAKGGALFGAFISEGLDISNIENYRRDKSAFIFSLTKGTVHYQRNKTMPVVFHSRQYISLGHKLKEWDNWDDISLKNTCNGDTWSYSDFGYAFIPPQGITPGTPEAQTYMAGSYRWMCDDVEIWAVIDA